MGAVVALETARTLEARGVRISHLFASGSREAEPEAPDADVFGEDDEAAAERLVLLGGTAPELVADPLFLELVLPYVRSDSRMYHAYDFRLEPPLHCPVTAVVGEDDADADLRPWGKLTGGAFRQLVVRGDHFYLLREPPYALIRDCLDATTSRGS
jgi:surfactin synthase thioesterase subunit